MVIAVAGGAWIFLGVVILMLVGVVIGFYTRGAAALTCIPTGMSTGVPGCQPPHARRRGLRSNGGARARSREAVAEPGPTGACSPEERAAERAKAQRPKSSKYDKYQRPTRDEK